MNWVLEIPSSPRAHPLSTERAPEVCCLDAFLEALLAYFMLARIDNWLSDQLVADRTARYIHHLNFGATNGMVSTGRYGSTTCSMRENPSTRVRRLPYVLH